MLFRQTLFALGCTASLFAANRVETLTPPKLEKETIATEVRCVRPMREGTFNISSEDLGEKFVVHCYGHGGCGWTTFMGSVERAIELFQMRYPSPETTPPIRVIGTGCMGLCSAIELTRKGYSVTGITTDELYNIPSWNAAGYFALVSVKISPEEEETVNRINLSTFHSYQKMEKGEHPYLSSNAVRWLPVYCSQDTHAGVEELEEQGLIPPREIVDLDFGNGVIRHDFVKFMTYFFDVTTLMRELHAEVARLGIPIEMGKVETFDDVSENLVFNCTGLGGGDLAKDFKMIPVRGHLFMLNEGAGQAHMDYMIYSKVLQEGKEEYVYLFPRTQYITPENPAGIRCYGVLGGTFIPGAEKLSSADLAELDAKEFQRLFDRNVQFFYGSL
jgi:D-amino-acid oxidase